MKKNLNWALAAARMIRLPPTLPLLAHIWTAYLARLRAAGEPDLVECLKSYVRPSLQRALRSRCQHATAELTYVRLAEIGGKGGIEHVLGANLYTSHFVQWWPDQHIIHFCFVALRAPGALRAHVALMSCSSSLL